MFFHKSFCFVVFIEFEFEWKERKTSHFVAIRICRLLEWLKRAFLIFSIEVGSLKMQLYSYFIVSTFFFSFSFNTITLYEIGKVFVLLSNFWIFLQLLENLIFAKVFLLLLLDWGINFSSQTKLEITSQYKSSKNKSLKFQLFCDCVECPKNKYKRELKNSPVAHEKRQQKKRREKYFLIQFRKSSN